MRGSSVSHLFIEGWRPRQVADGRIDTAAKILKNHGEEPDLQSQSRMDGWRKCRGVDAKSMFATSLEFWLLATASFPWPQPAPGVPHYQNSRNQGWGYMWEHPIFGLGDFSKGC